MQEVQLAIEATVFVEDEFCGERVRDVYERCPQIKWGRFLGKRCKLFDNVRLKHSAATYPHEWVRCAACLEAIPVPEKLQQPPAMKISIAS